MCAIPCAFLHAKELCKSIFRNPFPRSCDCHALRNTARWVNLFTWGMRMALLVVMDSTRKKKVLLLLLRHCHGNLLNRMKLTLLAHINSQHRFCVHNILKRKLWAITKQILRSTRQFGLINRMLKLTHVNICCCSSRGHAALRGIPSEACCCDVVKRRKLRDSACGIRSTWKTWPVDVTELFPRICCWTLIRLSRHWAWLCWGYWRYRSLIDWLIDWLKGAHGKLALVSE